MTTHNASTPAATPLRGRAALVTGGAHGIGRSYCRALAGAGAKVVLADIDAEGARATAESLRADGAETVDVAVDVADEASVARCRESAEAQAGPIDILVNNAAVFATVPMSRCGYAELTVEEWDRMMAVNLRGMWLMCRELVPPMQERGYGKVVNISSGTALKRVATRIHYVASKAGVLGLTRVLATEVGADGVTVNCIAPGNTPPEQRDASAVARSAATVAQRAIPREQTPEDLLGALLFFASPASDFVTGQTLVVDGGACMH